MAVLSIHQPRKFLTLPREIREQIYHEVLLDSPTSLLNLLTVNSTVNKEVSPWILKQPLYFNGQQSLFEWLAQIDPALLVHVGQIRFRLHDIDPRKILGSLGERLRRAKLQDQNYTGSPYQEACDSEVSRVVDALKRLKRLRSFSVLANLSSNPKPPWQMLSTFATKIFKNLPLVSISVSSDLLYYMDYPLDLRIQELHVFDFLHVRLGSLHGDLRLFTNLQSLKICKGWQSTQTGYPMFSESTSPLTFRNKLPLLQDLTMCLYDMGLGLSGLQPIAPTTSKHNIAVQGECLKSLQSLRLWCDGCPPGSAPAYRPLQFLDVPSLSHIETGYFCTPAPDDYPATIVSFGIIFGRDLDRFPDWIHNFYNVVQSPSMNFFESHPLLQEILLYLPSDAYGKLQGIKWGVQVFKDMVAMRCGQHGVRLKVLYKDFSCDHRHVYY
ncbi:MAG: hypothetical protein Q9220_007320 [cf. Caloplaca sp. 1 TL-2023]